MDRRLKANRENWNDRVSIHTQSDFYDVEGWLRRSPGPAPREVALIGDVKGKTLVQLQCHFGQETLQWVRAGARVTGVDFSPAAIEAATELSKSAGLDDRSRFVCSNVYDAGENLGGEQFDVVYVTIGSLCWLPELRPWAKVVAELLAPGGQFYLFEVHPFTNSFDSDGVHLLYDYFEEPSAPQIWDSDTTYTDGGAVAHPRSYQWNHSLSEIVQSLIDEGLRIDTLIEHDWTVFQQFPWLEKDGEGLFQIPLGYPRLPLMFTLHARI
jgi:SAM-dependent methyltransferase